MKMKCIVSRSYKRLQCLISNFNRVSNISDVTSLETRNCNRPTGDLLAEHDGNLFRYGKKISLLSVTWCKQRQPLGRKTHQQDTATYSFLSVLDCIADMDQSLPIADPRTRWSKIGDDCFLLFVFEGDSRDNRMTLLDWEWNACHSIAH